MFVGLFVVRCVFLCVCGRVCGFVYERMFVFECGDVCLCGYVKKTQKLLYLSAACVFDKNVKA